MKLSNVISALRIRRGGILSPFHDVDIRALKFSLILTEEQRALGHRDDELFLSVDTGSRALFEDFRACVNLLAQEALGNPQVQFLFILKREPDVMLPIIGMCYRNRDVRFTPAKFYDLLG
jgi:hypothetical protein